jgi:glycosyltransferase involved in cell wall biosynthesis
MAVYNRDRYLASAIESVLRQSLSDWELHIVDDCSSDDSLAIARDYASRDPRIKVYFNDSNEGFGCTLRSALSQCDAQYLCWLDSDDELMPTALETMVRYLDEHPGAGMAYSQYVTMDLNGHDTGLGYRCEIPYSPDRLLVDLMIFHLQVIRSDAYHRVGGINPELRAAVDYDFCLRASEAIEIHQVPEVLYRYRQHADCISHNDRVNQIEQSRQAIERALVRRGMSESHRLEIKSHFRLERLHG